MRRLIVALLVALACSAWPLAAHAADPSWQVSVGFGGLAKEGAWTPVFVDITNEGDSQTGRIVVPVQYQTSSARPRVVPYVTEVEVPRHAKKRYAVYVPSVDLGRIALDLSGYRGEKDLPRFATAAHGDLVLVVVGGDPGFLSFLNGVTGLGVSSPVSTGFDPMGGGSQGYPGRTVNAAVGRLDWANLPESWLGWEGADVVVLGDASFSSASPAALEALRTWVELGGTLILPGGALGPAVSSGPFASLLPGTVTGTATLPDLRALGAWVGRPLEPQPVLVAQLALSRPVNVLCASGAQPLVVARRLGSGRVVLTTFDYTAAPLKYWDGQSVFWPKLLQLRVPPAALARRAETGDEWGGPTIDLVRTVSTMPQAELPSLWLIIGFLAAYLVVLVPANYWVLNRLDRRELAWVTTPAIVLLFTFGAYGLGYGLRGGAIIFHRIGIVEAGAGASSGRGTAYLGLFSPARTSYELAVDAPSAGGRDLSLADQHVRAGTQVYTAPKPRISDIAMNMWTTRAFAVDYRAELGRGVSGFLVYDGATLRARVRNDTGGPLREARIVCARQQGKTADIEAGEHGDLQFVPGKAGGIPSTPPGQAAASTPDLSRMAMGALFLLPTRLPQSPEGLPVVVAHAPEVKIPATLTGEHPATADVSLLVVHLPARIARHQTVQVPDWLVSHRFLAASGSVSIGVPDPNAGPNLFALDHGEMIGEYTLPLAGAPATAIRLSLVPWAGVLPNAEISAYDFTHRTWQTLWRGAAAAPSTPTAPVGGRMWRGGRGGGMVGSVSGGPPGGGSAPSKGLALPHPQDFMSPEGKVQVRVSLPNGSGPVSPLLLRATVEVR